VTFREPPSSRKRNLFSEDDMKTRLNEAREADMRIIGELVLEVKQLESLLANQNRSRTSDGPASPQSTDSPASTSAVESTISTPKDSGWAAPTLSVMVPVLSVIVAVFWFTIQQLLRHMRESAPNQL